MSKTAFMAALVDGCCMTLERQKILQDRQTQIRSSTVWYALNALFDNPEHLGWNHKAQASHWMPLATTLLLHPTFAQELVGGAMIRKNYWQGFSDCDC